VLHRKSKQRGISFIGIVFIGAVLAGLGVLGAQAFPTVVEFQSILKAAQKAAITGNTVPEVRTIFDKATEVDDIKSISGKDLDITKEGDKIVVRFAYNKEIPMFGPAYLLLKYKGQTK
jgi:Domain of unknown function (DUF4845)